MIIALHTYALAFTWDHYVQLGDHVLIYHNDTLLYNITFDVDRRTHVTYAFIYDVLHDEHLTENVDWNEVHLDDTNISIIATRANLTNKTVRVIISGPDNYTVLLQSELIRNETESENLTAPNVTNSTPSNLTANSTSNVTAQNQTNTTEVGEATATTSNSTNTANSSNMTPAQCQELIDNLTAQLEQLKQERDELLKQIQLLQQQLNMTQTENEQLRKQIKILQQALEEKNRRIRELEEEIAELKKQQWSWKTFQEKSEEQYILWTPWIFPLVLGGLVVSYRRYKHMRKYMDVQIDVKARELKEELLSEYLKKDLLNAKIETIVDDPNLLVILRTIIPQLTGSQEITKGDILTLDVDQVAELARKKFLLKENRVEYLKKKLLELKEKIKEEAGGNV